MSNCELCGEPMPEGEAMFKFHGYSGPCPKPSLPRKALEPSRPQLEAAAQVMNSEGFDIKFPWERDLDEVEQARYETFSKAIAAALAVS